MKFPSFPADHIIAKPDGSLTDGFWQMFDSTVKALRQAVFGGLALTHAGAIPKVASPGTLTESRLLESEVLSMTQATQSGLAALAATLGMADAGKLVEVTDFRHILRWTGAAWQWGPNEDGRHDIVGLPVDPSPTTGWQLCDGTTVTYLKGDGTTGSYATPNLVSTPAYLKLGTPVTGINAATAPGFTGATTGTSATGVTATTAATATNVTVNQGAGGAAQSVSLSTHTHAVSIADPTHSHSLTASVAADGEPANVVLRPWFRR